MPIPDLVSFFLLHMNKSTNFWHEVDEVVEGVGVDDKVVHEVAGESRDDLVNWVKLFDDVGEDLVAQFEEKSVLAFSFGDHWMFEDFTSFQRGH